MIPVAFFPHSSIGASPSHHPAADVNKYRVTQPDTLQRDLKTLIPKRDVSIKSVPSGLREPWVEEVAKEQEGGHQENKSL